MHSFRRLTAVAECSSVEHAHSRKLSPAGYESRAVDLGNTQVLRWLHKPVEIYEACLWKGLCSHILSAWLVLGVGRKLTVDSSAVTTPTFIELEAGSQHTARALTTHGRRKIPQLTFGRSCARTSPKAPLCVVAHAYDYSQQCAASNIAILPQRRIPHRYNAL